MPKHSVNLNQGKVEEAQQVYIRSKGSAHGAMQELLERGFDLAVDELRKSLSGDKRNIAPVPVRLPVPKTERYSVADIPMENGNGDHNEVPRNDLDRRIEDARDVQGELRRTLEEPPRAGKTVRKKKA